MESATCLHWRFNRHDFENMYETVRPARRQKCIVHQLNVSFPNDGKYTLNIVQPSGQ